MEKIEFTDSETVERTVLDTTLEIKIKDFRTSGKEVREEKYMKHKNSSYDLKVNIVVFAFPNGADKDTKGWLLVVPNVYLEPVIVIRPTNLAVSWILSVIDVEGNSRFPLSFEIKLGTLESLTDSDLSHLKYLERSFILKRADEFLPGGVLTLRCDVYLYLSGVSLGIPSRRLSARHQSNFRKFFDLLPQAVCSENEAEKGDWADASTVFDLTSEVLTSPQLQEIFGGFGLHFGSPKVELTPLESKEDITDISENVWVFEARPDKFILSLDERKDTVGARILKASSLIRECVGIPLKGQQEKLIKLQKADSEIFRIVLYFLLVGTLRGFEFYKLLDVYKFCHLYEMKELQIRCVEYMVAYMVKYDTNIRILGLEDIPEEIGFDFNFENELSYFEELERIAELYSDEYLSELLELRRRENENLEKDFPRLRKEESPCFDCYN